MRITHCGYRMAVAEQRLQDAFLRHGGVLVLVEQHHVVLLTNHRDDAWQRHEFGGEAHVVAEVDDPVD